METVAIALDPFCRPSPYPVPSMYNLRQNCSSLSSDLIGILVVAVVALTANVALY